MCLFVQHKGDNADYSSIKIEKYNRELNIFEEAGEISLGDRNFFDGIFHENKIYALGGCVNGARVKSVSAISTKCEKRIERLNGFPKNVHR